MANALEAGERPAPTSAPTRPAPLRHRCAAFVYDALVVVAVWVVTIVALVTLVGDAVVGAWVQSLLFIELYAFFAYFWCRPGQTIGMLAWRLRIESTTGGRIGPRQALKRFVADLASFALLGGGFFWAWFDKQGLTLADRFSGSVVVRTPKARRR